jgi:CRISPR/Cas system-associated exonuclease Cas4 (RecB family)
VIGLLLSTLLTHSRLKTARACRRRHQYQYLLGYRSTAEREELDFGSLIHLALEAWWLGVQAALPVDAWLRMALHQIGVSKLDAYVRAKAEVLMIGYHTRWADEAADFEVLGVEERFEYSLRNPETGRTSPLWRVGGRLDVRVRRRSTSDFGFVEHKTSGEDISPGSTYWKRLRLDSQVSIYFDGADSLGQSSTFCLYDVIGKPGQRPLKATPEEKRKLKKDGTPYASIRLADESPDEYRDRLIAAVVEKPEEYFVRGEVVRLERELDEARHDMWQQGAQLREEIRAERFPKNVDACQYCSFFPVCTGEASLDDPTKYRRSSTVHPELESEAAEATCQP